MPPADSEATRTDLKKPYTPPRLVYHGTLADLTRGAVFTNTPGDAFSLG